MIRRDDIGSIEASNRADLAVLDRDFFAVPDEDIRRIRSLLSKSDHAQVKLNPFILGGGPQGPRSYRSIPKE